MIRRYDDRLRPCPRCGGKMVLVGVADGGAPDLWCTECEAVWVVNATEAAVGWWNGRDDGEKA